MGAEVIPRLTFEEFRALPEDGKRYELIKGELHLTLAPTTRHQYVVINLSSSLAPHVSKGGARCRLVRTPRCPPGQRHGGAA